MRLGDWIGLIVEIQAAEARCESPVRSIAPKFFGGSALATAVEPVQRAARSDLPIIMQGETGTGKECLARAVHSWSKRSGSFLAVNCAALPESLAEGELFGYRKGAFTGADRAHPGYFRAAQNGTLLLDEVSDLPLSLQGKLLRVLEQREVLPLGESRPIEVDVRIIAAAQEPLSQAVAERRFRGDLYARLCGLEVQLPPLRDRIEDVPGLFARFLHERSGGQPPRVEPRLVEQLCLYDWPFNVRELELLSRRLLALHGHEPALRRSLLPKQFLEGGPVEDAGRPRARTSSEPPAETSDAMEAQVEGQSRDERDLLRLVAALRRSKGNVARAAAEAGISRQRAYRLMQGHAGIELDAFRQAPRAPGS